jgi:hypothetical protein
VIRSLVFAVKAGLLDVGWYARRLEKDVFPGVVVLCYHGLRPSNADDQRIPFANLHVVADWFDSHCRMIAETCHPIDLETFCRARSGADPLPDRPVVAHRMAWPGRDNRPAGEASDALPRDRSPPSNRPPPAAQAVVRRPRAAGHVGRAHQRRRR